MNYGWAEPLYGDEAFPPHLKHDDMAIVNPDFWDEGVDQNTFKGWMRMTEVGVSFSSLPLLELTLLPFLLVGPGPMYRSPFTSQMNRGGESRRSLPSLERSTQGYSPPAVGITEGGSLCERGGEADGEVVDSGGRCGGLGGRAGSSG